MKIPLIAACFVAGSAWSFAFADQTTTTNPKTAQRSFTQQKNPLDGGTATSIRGAGIKAQKQAAQAPAKITREEYMAQLQARKLAGIGQPAPMVGGGGFQQGSMSGSGGSLAVGGGDDCGTADVITGTGTFAFDCNPATTGTQQQSCGGGCNSDVWFSWTAPSTGTATYTTCGGSGMDTVIAVWDGSGCGTSAIICNDDNCGLQSSVNFPVVGGNNYMLQLGGYFGNPGAGSFTLSVAGPVTNDDCTSPIAIAGNGTFAFSSIGASTGTDGQSESLCAVEYGNPTVENDVWYSWTAPYSGQAIMSLCGGTGLDSKIAAYNGAGCPVAGTALDCNDDTCGAPAFQSQIAFAVTGGSTYTLQLGSFPGTAGGAGTFTMSVQVPTGTDTCAAAYAFSGQGTFPFDNSAATTGTEGQTEALCNAFATTGVSNDVWFAWTPTLTGMATYTLCGGASMDSKIAAYPGTACPTAGSALACNDDTCGLQSSISFPVTFNTPVLLQLGNYPTAAGGTGTFTVSVLSSVPNDDCATPTPIAGLGQFAYDTTGANTSAEQVGLCATANQDIWFSWTAPISGTAVMQTCGLASYDTVLAAWPGTGCPAPGTGLACNDDNCASLQSMIMFPVTAGSPYMLQVGGFGGNFGPATFDLNVVLPPANDDCTTPTVISGLGIFPYDNVAATIGIDGQNEPLCAVQYGQFTVDHDVWFTWTAPSSGLCVFETCGLISFDSKLAAYQGTGCPVAGTALACNDDTCGWDTTCIFPVTGGTTYTLQVGNFPGDSGGLGSFSLNVVIPPPNDDCTAPTLISGLGSFPFDNTVASTGTQGQSSCISYGSPVIDHDLWYEWVAPSSGRCNLTTCGFTSVDTKIAVYQGSGCPAGSTVACNDDACGAFQSQLCFDVTGGTTYTIQVGTFPNSTGGFGSFDISISPALPPCTLDDGTTENLLVWTAGGDMVWLNRFGSVGGNTVLSSIDVMWGSAMFPGYNPASNGDLATDIFVWQDGITQDGDPSDATLLLQIPTTVTVWDTDTYVSFPITPITISGIFFLGSHQDSYGLSGLGPTQFVAPMDANCPSSGVAWFFGTNTGFGTSPTNYGNPGANLQPPATFDSIGLPCQVMVRGGCNSGPASYLCDPGSGPTIACPCSNPPSGSSRGCDNSSATGGASISGAGSNSLATPTLAFTTANEKPTATTILLQGTASNTSGLVFGQGVRCVTGVLKRLYVKTAVGGSILAPNFGGGDVDIPARSSFLGDPISAGQSRWYIAYYRDPIVLGGCNALATFNATNTAEVLWQP